MKVFTQLGLGPLRSEIVSVSVSAGCSINDQGNEDLRLALPVF